MGLDCSGHCDYGRCSDHYTNPSTRAQRAMTHSDPPTPKTAASDLFRRGPDRYVDVGEGEAAYWRVGEGPDVLFVHGWPVSGATWRCLLPHLVDHVTCHVIDFPSAGWSRFTDTTVLTVDQHVATVRRVVDVLGLDSVAVVGHDSGGLIARHAMVGDTRLRTLGLIDTEPRDVGWRFRSFIAARRLPGVGAGLGWVAGRRRLRRNPMVFGGAFVDRSLLDGEFDEFFLRPLREDRRRRDAAVRVFRSFDMQLVHDLDEVHRRIDVPVQLVWGAHDPFFPVASARTMVGTFPDARLEVIADASLFSHEERPAEVAAALLPTLLGTR
jgi:haloalkane dehalogenase